VMQAMVSADATSIVFVVSDATSVGLVRSLSVTSPAGSDSTNVTVIHLVINELDADTVGTDANEFVEITTGIAAAVDLTGYQLVLVNGSTDTSYSATALATTDAAGYFVVGNAGVVPDAMIANDFLQNGADAAAIVQSASVVANGTAVASLAVLIDALVYDTNDGDDAALLSALLGAAPEAVQINEAARGTSDVDSIQRCGTARLDGRAFTIIDAPTLRAATVCSFSAATVQARFDATCAGCHTGGGAMGGLALDSFETTAIGEPSSAAGMHYIAAGSRATSYLYHKLANTHLSVPGGNGARMPFGGPFWSPADIERLGAYIDGL
jgi:mono/diheme cytochrome c family protein